MDDHAPPDETDARLTRALDSLEAADLEPSRPSEQVWRAIAGEVGIDPGAPDPAADHRTRGGGPLQPIAGHRRRTHLLAVAAVLALAVVGGGLLVSNGDEPDVVAAADLTWDAGSFDPLGARATASAALEGREGAYVIHVRTADLPRPASGEDLELWLLRPDESGQVADLVSLGRVDPAAPRPAAVPPGIDPREFSVVDISIEPRDGDEAHSGRSILRGDLPDA